MEPFVFLPKNGTLCVFAENLILLPLAEKCCFFAYCRNFDFFTSLPKIGMCAFF
jgi:hypothetical protein